MTVSQASLWNSSLHNVGFTELCSAIQCPILQLYKDCAFEDYIPFVFTIGGPVIITTVKQYKGLECKLIPWIFDP
jgi:hypothetical protein